MAETGTDRAAAPRGGSIASLAEAIKSDAVFPAPLPGSAGPGDPEPLASEPEKVYTAAEVMDLVTLPADTMYALTGNDRWILAEEEKKKLAERAGKALGLIMKIEPKWFVIWSAIAVFGSVYGTRGVAEFKDYMDKKKKEETSK